MLIVITDNPAHDIPMILGMDFKLINYWAVKHPHATYLWVTKVYSWWLWLLSQDYDPKTSLLEDRNRYKYKAIRESNNSHFTCISFLNVWISCGLKNGEVWTIAEQINWIHLWYAIYIICNERKDLKMTEIRIVSSVNIRLYCNWSVLKNGTACPMCL